jgi:hypothetical protein
MVAMSSKGQKRLRAMSSRSTNGMGENGVLFPITSFQ